MKFHLVYPPPSGNGQSPVRVVEQTTGREVGWINRFLDREYVRRLGDKTLRTYAHHLLHFVRWWDSIHHTSDVVESNLAESTLLDLRRSREVTHFCSDRVAHAENRPATWHEMERTDIIPPQAAKSRVCRGQLGLMA